MSKLNMSRIDDAETILRKELSTFKEKPRKGKDLDRLKRLEDIVTRLELLRLAGVVFLIALLGGCVFYGDESIPGDDTVEADAAVEPEPDAGFADAAPEPQVCEPVGLYDVTFTPGSGTCNVDDLGALVFKVVETGPGSWYIDPGTTPLVDGTVHDVDGKCEINIWRTAPYGQSVQQIHVSMREDDDGDGLAYGVAMMGLYNYQTGYTCMQMYAVTATVDQ